MLEGKSKKLLNATNYVYNLLGVAIPCVIILIISIIIIYRTCRNDRYTNKEGTSFYYIAGTIGIIHSLFILPGRFSDILLMSLSPYAYASFFPHLISFNHEAQSFISLSYGYKFFICIYISRRFRLHAKSVLCFLIENKYEDRHTIEIVNTTNDCRHLSKGKQHKRNYHYYGKDSYFNKIPVCLSHILFSKKMHRYCSQKIYMISELDRLMSWCLIDNSIRNLFLNIISIGGRL
jgi:hypothetical protein